MTPHHRRTAESRESGLVQRVRASLRIVPVNKPHILLACSGGRDSVALAWVLGELLRLDLIGLSIAHVHHGQHNLADAAADAVRQIGATLDVPVDVRHLSRQQIASHRGVGLEEALRRERYVELARVARERSTDALALAHHQSDQAETLLLHLIRGSGLSGLAGMREWETRRIPWWTTSESVGEMGLWRPFIQEPADEVTAVAAASGLPVVEDPTNRDTAFRRNAIRHQLLPVIEAIAPGSTASVARTAHLVAPDADLLDELTSRHLGACREGNRLVRHDVVALPLSLQRRVVRAWLESLVPEGEFTINRISAVLDIAHRNRGGASVEVGAGSIVVLRDGYLVLLPWQNRNR